MENSKISLLSNFNIGDFIRAEVVGHIYGRRYNLLINNSFNLIAYCLGPRLKNGKYIFKLVSKSGGIKLELLSSYEEGVNISYLIRRFRSLSSADDKPLIGRIVKVYLKYNLKIEEREIMDLYKFIRACIDNHSSIYSVEELIIIGFKGISVNDMRLYFNEISSLESSFRFKEADDFLSLLDCSLESINVVDIFNSFSSLILREENAVYSIDNIVSLERSSFLKPSMSSKDFCFFSLPCSLGFRQLRFLLIKLLFRGGGNYSIHFTLSLGVSQSGGLKRVKGVIFNTANRFFIRVLSDGLSFSSAMKAFKSGGSLNDNIFAKRFILYERTINENNDLAEEINKICYGLLSYGSLPNSYLIGSMVYFLLGEMLYNVSLFLRDCGAY